MANSTAPYRFHPVIEKAYIATNRWLSGQPEARGYNKLPYGRVQELLEEESLLSAASQFHTYFPTHYFKAIYVIDQVIGQARLLEWLGPNPKICILDIGCGSGAGSIAFVDSVLRLEETGSITNPIDLYCLGVDPNPYAIGMYNSLFLALSNELRTCSSVNLKHAVKCEGIPNATGWIIHRLDSVREEWGLPYLPHVVIVQMNVVSPLTKDYHKRKDNVDILRRLGVDDAATPDANDEFGFEEALAYKSIFESVEIDHMHLITIGTVNYMIDTHVTEMGASLRQVFNTRRHQTLLIGDGQHQATFINPPSGRFAQNTEPYDTTFNIDVTSVTNQEFRGDRAWHEVISQENLQLAWAKVRYQLSGDSLVDELEIRLFERNLDENLDRVRQQLIAYAEEVAHYDDYVAYKVPKSRSKTRPRGLSRIEEEILAAAIVQRLGSERSQLHRRSYAYRIAQRSRGRDTESL